MDLKKLFTDDDAVSPVIGVILMVAITVILAAVIASFVLGLGQDAGDNSPQASFDIEYDASNGLTNVSGAPSDGKIDITHQSGATIPDTNLFIRGSEIITNGTDGAWYNQSGAAGIPDGGEDVASGSSVAIGTNSSAYEVRVVWEPPEEDTSSTLQTQEGPEA